MMRQHGNLLLEETYILERPCEGLSSMTFSQEGVLGIPIHPARAFLPRRGVRGFWVGIRMLMLTKEPRSRGEKTFCLVPKRED